MAAIDRATDREGKTLQTALICVLVAGLLPYAFTAVAKATGPRYDNRDVRSWQGRLAGLPYRAHAAHLNSFEAFPLFAVAVLAAYVTGADASRVSLLAMAFVALRLAYFAVYLANLALLRSAVWFAAIGCSVAILAMAIRAAH
jgi:uncharacterized MAPEG superfamily protein